MDTGEDPEVATVMVAEDLRAAGADAQQLADHLAKPAGTLLSMAHQGRIRLPGNLLGSWCHTGRSFSTSSR